ncbi:AI-2E family transporter [Rhodopirellula sp. JC740]|uniref:AI-2E family transporter n=1 Tax=Rhodopirellula halodulae TaxID=2894198 RepID=A0ABS8NGE9_9BACT|nr:AI-2E family transporter [Rhodopirellula sp. JC740]MCC9642022.1 AI-2E family transporter [Rhodopirellula sp. JC740]
MEGSSFVRRVLLACAVVLVFVALSALMVAARDLLPLIFGAVLIAVVLNALAAKLARWLPDFLGQTGRVSLVIASLLLLAGLTTYSFANSAAQKTMQFRDRIQKSFQESVETLRDQPVIGEQLPEKEELPSMMPSSGKSLGLLKNFFTSTFGGLVDVLILFFLALYFAVSPEKYRVGVIRLLPLSWRTHVSELMSDSSETLWRWMIGRLIAMALVGILFGVGLSFIGVPMPLELGVFAGLVTFIPNIGGVAAVVPALLLSFQEGTSAMVAVLVLYLAIQTVESYFITPMIQERQVELPPAMVILAQILGGIIFGFWGVVFATPMVAVSMLWINRLYVEEWLEA